MSAETLVQLLYLISTALFILSLRWMSDPETARKGVFSGVAAYGVGFCGNDGTQRRQAHRQRQRVAIVNAGSPSRSVQHV